ncbi:MAG: hypothetical protein ACI9TA_003591, partial [Reinekea sp.]
SCTNRLTDVVDSPSFRAAAAKLPFLATSTNAFIAFTLVIL